MIDHFSFIAPYYDRFLGSMDSVKIKDILELPSGGWILDAGGGTGRVSSNLVDGSRGVIVCDISRPMLRQGVDKARILPVQSTVHRLPFRDDSIERIIVVDALHHFKHPETAIRELTRILKPGGKLVIEEFDIQFLRVKVIAFVEKILLMGSHFHTPEEICQMAAAPDLTTAIHRNAAYSVWVVIEKSDKMVS